MKILVLGSKGQLGWELCRLSQTMDVETLPYDLPEFDITDQTQVTELVSSSHASLVINVAAYTAVDRAETEADLAYAVNQKGPAHVADACHQRGIPLIHISTDYVFDGEKKTPYVEDDKVAPINVYGHSKAEGEKEVTNRISHHIIVRTSWMYSSHGNNFVKTILRVAQMNESLNVVDDQFGSPTYAADLAEALLKISMQYFQNGTLPWGIYHYCNAGVISWYEFAQAIVTIYSDFKTLTVKKINPIKTKDYKTIAKRPANSSLNCQRITSTFSLSQKDWQESLSAMINSSSTLYPIP
jgi:dTDP-4-dehydrorhamnose reductase